MNRPLLSFILTVLVILVFLVAYACNRPEPTTPIEETTEAQETTQEKNEPIETTVSPGPNESETLPDTGPSK